AGGPRRGSQPRGPRDALRLTAGCSTQGQRILSKSLPPGQLAHPTELTRGNARPAPEGAREVGMVRVSEIERDIENRRVGFLEDPDGRRDAPVRDEPGDRAPRLGHPALGGADADADR